MKTRDVLPDSALYLSGDLLIAALQEEGDTASTSFHRQEVSFDTACESLERPPASTQIVAIVFTVLVRERLGETHKLSQAGGQLRQRMLVNHCAATTGACGGVGR